MYTVVTQCILGKTTNIDRKQVIHCQVNNHSITDLTDNSQILIMCLPYILVHHRLKQTSSDEQQELKKCCTFSQCDSHSYIAASLSTNQSTYLLLASSDLLVHQYRKVTTCLFLAQMTFMLDSVLLTQHRLSLIHIWRCRRIERCRSRWSPYH